MGESGGADGLLGDPVLLFASMVVGVRSTTKRFFRSGLQTSLTRFSSWVWGDDPCPGWAGEFLRTCCRVGGIVGREFRRDQIPLRASALTFTVILSLVPLLALGTSVVKGLGAGGQMRQAAHILISQMEVTADFAAGPGAPSALGAEPGLAMLPQWSPTSLSGHLHRVTDTVFDYVDQTKFATMGLIGTLVLLFTVYTLLGSIEKTFNTIWQTDGNRTLGRKLVDYLALLVVLPLSVNFVVAAMAALKSPRLLAKIQQALPWLGPLFLTLLPMVVLMGTFALLYVFLPNIRVQKSAALTGGLLGGLAWLLLQLIYFKLQIVVVRYNAIYGSFAALPLFLLWMYLSWVVFLLGAEISFATQTRRRYHWRQPALFPLARMALAFEILLCAAEDYRGKRLTTRDRLVEALRQPDQDVAELLTLLQRAGVMRFVSEGEGGYLPVAPLAQLSAAEIGRLLLGDLPDTVPDDNPARPALAALYAALAGSKLAERAPE